MHDAKGGRRVSVTMTLIFFQNSLDVPPYRFTVNYKHSEKHATQLSRAI